MCAARVSSTVRHVHSGPARGAAALLLVACTEYVGGVPGDEASPSIGPPGIDAGSSSGAPSDGDAGATEDGSVDASVAPEPVEVLATGLAEVLDFAVDGEQLAWLSSSIGVRRCTLPSCTDTQLVLSPSEDLRAPIAMADGRAFYVERYREFVFTRHRLRSVTLDGSDVQTLDSGQLEAGARLLADASGVTFTRTKGVDDNVYSRQAVRRRDANEQVLRSSVSNFTAPMRIDRGYGRTALAWRNTASGHRLVVLDAQDEELPVADGLPEISSLAVSPDAIFVVADGALLRCVASPDGCAAYPESAPLLEGVQQVAVVGAQLLVATRDDDGDRLQLCEQAACEPFPAGFLVIDSLRSFGERFYALGHDPAGADAGDAGITYAVHRYRP